MNKMPWFFLILLTAVLVFISIKPLEGFDISRNYIKPKPRDISYNIMYSGKVSNATVIEDSDMFSPSNVALVTIGVVLFIILIFLIIKLKS